MTSRTVRLLKMIEAYTKKKPSNFDSNVVFNKVKVISVSDGTTRSQFKIDTSMCNGGDTLHGGFVAACSDVLSVFTNLGNTGKIAWTMSLHIEFISSAQIGEGITVDTTVIRKGSYPVMETKFNKADGTLVAKGIISMVNGNEKYQGMLKDIYGIEAKV